MTLKIATWNVNSLRVRLPHVEEWVENNQPDVLALQELKMPTEEFPLDVFEKMGYKAAVSGQKTYNGVAVLSKQDPADIVTDIPDLDDPQRRVMGVTIGDVRVLDLYVPNGSEVGSEKYAYKLDWLNKLTSFLKQQLEQYPKTIVLGDFNIAPADIDVHKPERWEGKVLCSEPERNALQAIMDLGFKDCFREMEPDEQAFSWWDYRLNAFKRNWGLRIDLILASKKMFLSCESSSIDTTPRELDRPSDHAPVVAVFS